MDVEVVDPIWAGGGHERVEHDVGAQKHVGPGVRDHVHVEGGDPAVPGDPGAVRHDEGVALAVADERVLARVLEAHGAPGPQCEEGEVDLDGQVLLAAEPSTNEGAADPDPVVRHSDRVRDRPEVLDHLRRDADVDDAVLVQPREAHLGLEEGVLLERRAEGVLDDEVRSREARVEVALADPAFGDDVGRALDDRGVRPQRFDGVVDPREGLELDLDEVHRVVRDVPGLRRDEGEGLAEVPDPLLDEDLLPGVEPFLAGLPRNVRRGRAVGEVVAGEDARHPLQGPRLRHVEALEARARAIRPDHPHVQHVRHHVVARVGRAPGDLARRVGAREGPSDLAEADVGEGGGAARGGAHQSLPAARRAAPASATASNTFV